MQLLDVLLAPLLAAAFSELPHEVAEHAVGDAEADHSG